MYLFSGQQWRNRHRKQPYKHGGGRGECEMYGDTDLSGYDYLIGAVHYLKIGTELFSIDRSLQDLQAVIEKHFHGNGMACAKEYYRQLARLPEYGDFDFINGISDLMVYTFDNSWFVGAINNFLSEFDKNNIITRPDPNKTQVMISFVTKV